MARRRLSLVEQANIRAYLRYLRHVLGGWEVVHRAAGISHVWRIAIMEGRGTPTTEIAFRIAKVLDVSVHDVLAGTALPPGTCKHCGRAVDG